MKKGTGLPTHEMRGDMPSAFIDEDDGPEPSLTNPRISQMAYDAVFMYQPEFQKPSPKVTN